MVQQQQIPSLLLNDMATITETKKYLPIGYDESDFTLDSLYSGRARITTNDADATNYALFKVPTTTDGTFYVHYMFDFSDIPENATITNCTWRAKLYGNGNGNYISFRRIRLYKGNTISGTPKNTSTTFSNTAHVYSGTINTTREELQTITIRFDEQRTNLTTSSKYNIYIYGADITVTYEYNDTNNQAFLKNFCEWKPIYSVWKKNNGVWVESDDLTQVFEDNKVYLLKNE